jgi:hypothetical protein
MAYIPSLIGAVALFAICSMLSVMTLTGLQMTAAVIGALAVYAATIVSYLKASKWPTGCGSVSELPNMQRSVRPRRAQKTPRLSADRAPGTLEPQEARRLACFIGQPDKKQHSAERDQNRADDEFGCHVLHAGGMYAKILAEAHQIEDCGAASCVKKPCDGLVRATFRPIQTRWFDSPHAMEQLVQRLNSDILTKPIAP